jgi:hypothetical protein
MTNSECNLTPEKVLANLTDLLADDQLAKSVEEPIDLAAQVFRLNIVVPITHSEFNRVISAFVRHIYQSGIPLPRHLSDRQALSEAVFLLEKYYQNEGVKGYDGAMLDAVGGDMGCIEMVLSRLVESMKLAEREKYVQWAFVENYSMLDWNEQERIVSAFMKQNETLLPTELLELDPARLVDDFHEIFIQYMSTESLVRQLFQ